MGVATQQRRPRFPETLQMQLVADSVSGTGENFTVPLGNALQIIVVVGVLETDLNRVVIDITDRQIRLHAIDPHTLELEVHHRPRRILCQRLINPNRNFLSGDHPPRNQMRIQNFLHNIPSHLRLLRNQNGKHYTSF